MMPRIDPRRVDTPLDGQTDVFRRWRPQPATAEPGRRRGIVLNLYARLMIRVVVLVAVGVVLSLTLGRSVIMELAMVAGVFLPLTILMGIHAVRKVSVPVRQLIDASQRLLEGDYDAPVNVERSDEIGFLASVLENVQVYLRRNRAVMNAVIEAGTGWHGAAAGSIVELTGGTVREHLPVEALDLYTLDPASDPDGAWQRAGLEPMAAVDEPVRTRLARVSGRELAGPEAERTYVLALPDSTGYVTDIAVARVTRGRRLAGENLRYLRAILGVAVMQKERIRLRASVMARDRALRDARALDRVLAPNPAGALDGVLVDGFEIAFVERLRAAERKDWHARIDLRARGGPILVALGDSLVDGAGSAIARAAVGAACEALAVAGDPSVLPVGVVAAMDASVHRVGGGTLAASSLVIALRDGASGVEYACAGHVPPLHVSAHGGARELVARGALLGGGGEPRAPASRTINLAPGDVLLVFTDGLVDARDAGGGAFGPRLASLVRPGDDARAIAFRISKAFDETVRAEDPDADDASLLVVRRRPPAASARG
jgi:hypothetical protein